MHALVLIETCCHHYNGVLYVGTKGQCDEKALEWEGDFPRGYSLQTVEVGYDRNYWKGARDGDDQPIPGVTVNGQPVTRLEYLDEQGTG